MRIRHNCCYLTAVIALVMGGALVSKAAYAGYHENTERHEVIDGACGSADDVTTFSKPRADLCADGSASFVRERGKTVSAVLRPLWQV
jgi:hypothetical protein